MIRKWRTWRALSPGQKARTHRALRLLPLVRASVWLFGLARTQAWLRRLPVAGSRPKDTEAERAWAITRAVRTAQRYHRRWSNCLSHSLVLWTLLRAEGVAAEIRVGARLSAGRMEAHAWVVWQGQALTEPGDSAAGFVPFARPLVGRTP